MMARCVRCFVLLSGLLLSASAWALPQVGACRAKGRVAHAIAIDGTLCLALQDPWQDCNEDPWQLTSLASPVLTFSDPWQDSEDPWQPFPPLGRTLATPDTGEDPWQPLACTLDGFEDPWQPAFLDPWQEGADDPWQLP
jgi:hypothetical protein